MGINLHGKSLGCTVRDGTYMTDLCEISERLTACQFSLALSHSSQPETHKIINKKNGKQR
jgi:hypothetical protein